MRKKRRQFVAPGVGEGGDALSANQLGSGS